MLYEVITFIEGAALWRIIHNGIFGLFGVSVFLVAPIMIYAAIMIALEKERSTVYSKIFQGFMLILLFSAIVQIIFVGSVEGAGFAECLTNLYNRGMGLKGGGLMSVVLGWPLLYRNNFV